MGQEGAAAGSSLGPEAGPEEWESGMPRSNADFIQRLWEVRRAVIRGVIKADFRKGLHGSSMEDEQREAGSESRVSRLETHPATQERSDVSGNKVVCLYFGPERVFKNLNSS